MLDLHCDFIIQQRLIGYDALKKHRRGVKGQPLFWHSDLPRMREAEFVGACLGVHYFPWESERGWAEMNRQIDYVDRITEEADFAMRVRTPQDWLVARARGLLALAPGVEGAHMLNKRPERVAELAERGVAYLTLVHLGSNSAAKCSWGRGADQTSGLTELGREIIRALEANQILLDLAHVNRPGVLEACQMATQPVLCTHTGFQSLHPHPRMITDEELDAIAGTGGLVGIIMAPFFLCGKLRATSDCVIDHIVYAVERVGIEHVGIGTDFDGWLAMIPTDMRDCRDLGIIRDKLAARGFDADEIDDICWRNALRVLSRG